MILISSRTDLMANSNDLLIKKQNSLRASTIDENACNRAIDKSIIDFIIGRSAVFYSLAFPK